MKRNLLATFVALVALVISGVAFAAKVNLNTADAQALADGINGVGPTIAERIVQWREDNGPFESIDQLVEVKGIGDKILDENRENLSVEASSE